VLKPLCSGAAGETLTQGLILILVFWLVLPCGCVGRYHEALKMEAICSSKMLVSTYESTQCYNPEEQHQHLPSNPGLMV
jgi:hypothetical protein